jgi:hypothetical protein
MASEDKSNCGYDDRSHVDQGDDTRLARLSKKLGISAKEILDVMSKEHIALNQVEDYFYNKKNYY